MAPERGSGKRGNTACAEQNDTDVPVRVQAEPETNDARRHDEPQHEAVKMRFRAERQRSHRQHRNEHGNRKAMNETHAGQGDRDSIEEMSGQDHEETGGGTVGEDTAVCGMIGGYPRGPQR